MSARVRTALIAVSLVASMTFLAACAPEPTDGETPNAQTPSASAEPTATDLTDEILDDVPEVEYVATSPAAATSKLAGSTFEFASIQSTDTSAVFVFRIIGSDPASGDVSDLNPRGWDRFPVLATPTHDIRPVIYDRGEEWAALNNPLLHLDAGETTGAQAILYPPIPDGVDEVTVTSSWFDEVTIPVTRD